ncbi:hypothetical protein BWI93_10100 [Siphonobacter sp. BAB-5385]|uniref:hypothetical protein n=1 Tax=Siphonobacter sp. BAB-5385 TaxID=1864822 RepID=UPI000B9E1B7B|nr:hypothetical protein [Siphonobacter sp. BAB-5385]OZI08211.1 hypothetical protein BWI93_10100 [Siphonobacter sp. BAB-5385]
MTNSEAGTVVSRVENPLHDKHSYVKVLSELGFEMNGETNAWILAFRKVIEGHFTLEIRIPKDDPGAYPLLNLTIKERFGERSLFYCQEFYSLEELMQLIRRNGVYRQLISHKIGNLEELMD